MYATTGVLGDGLNANNPYYICVAIIEAANNWLTADRILRIL